MLKKAIKYIKDKESKIKFKYSQEEIFSFLKTNTGVSIVIAIILLFIAIGNPFVIGAVIGGYLGAKRTEELHKNSSNTPLILGASIGGILGGSFLVFSVALGSFFHMLGSILGAFAGTGAIIAFVGDLTARVSLRLMKFSFSKNTSKKDVIKKATKKYKAHKVLVSKRKIRLKTT